MLSAPKAIGMLKSTVEVLLTFNLALGNLCALLRGIIRFRFTPMDVQGVDVSVVLTNRKSSPRITPNELESLVKTPEVGYISNVVEGNAWQRVGSIYKESERKWRE